LHGSICHGNCRARCGNVHQLSECKPHRGMDMGLVVASAPLGLGVLIALGGILVMMAYLSE